MITDFTPGSNVFVVVQNPYTPTSVEVNEYMLLGVVDEYAVLVDYVDDIEDLGEILKMQEDDTKLTCFASAIAVYNLSLCFSNGDAADKAADDLVRSLTNDGGNIVADILPTV